MTKLIVTFAIFCSAPGYAGIAFKSGENTTGMTKTCFYNYLGSAYTKTVKSFELCPLSLEVDSSNPSAAQGNSGSGSGTAFKTGEESSSMTKNCFYNYLGNQYTKTVKSYELCPLSIKVP